MNKKKRFFFFFWGRREPEATKRRPRWWWRVCAVKASSYNLPNDAAEKKNGGKKNPGGSSVATWATSTGKNANLPGSSVRGKKWGRKKRAAYTVSATSNSFLGERGLSKLRQPIKVVQPSLASEGRKMINFTPSSCQTIPHTVPSDRVWKTFGESVNLTLDNKKNPSRCTCY